VANVPAPSECSTPFGIGEVFTCYWTAADVLDYLCSTPFGIGEVFTRDADQRPAE